MMHELPTHERARPPLALKGVTKRFGSVTALNDVSLTIGAGTATALLGPNGAGKTTLINLLLGLIGPDRGTVTVLGGPAGRLAARLRTGVVMQTGGIPDLLTVREHVETFGSYYSAPAPLDEVLKQTGLTRLQNRRYRHLSGGEKQRLQLALALSGDPDVLFLDEPTTGLDVESRRALWHVIDNLKEKGRTILLTTHYLEEADNLADRIVVLLDGRVTADGTPAEIKEKASGRRIRARTGLPLPWLGKLPGVLSATSTGGTVELLVTDAEDVTRTLLAEDPGLKELEVKASSLDEAFVALTGTQEGNS